MVSSDALVCPECGGRKSRRAKVCLACRRGASSSKPKVSVANGVEVVSVFGPRGCRVLLNVPLELAQAIMEGEPESAFVPTGVIDGVRHDLEQLGDAELLRSGLAAAALSLALTIENPYTSADGRSKCSKELREVVGQLRLLAPAEPVPTPVEGLQERARAKLRSVPDQVPGAAA